jgi:hypothetical protein
VKKLPVPLRAFEAALALGELLSRQIVAGEARRALEQPLEPPEAEPAAFATRRKVGPGEGLNPGEVAHSAILTLRIGDEIVEQRDEAAFAPDLVEKTLDIGAELSRLVVAQPARLEA